MLRPVSNRASMPAPAPSPRKTLRFARFVVRRRLPIAGLLILATLALAWPSANALFTALGRPLPGPALRIGANARDLFPDHPFVRVQDKFANAFGNSSIVAIAVVVEEGTIFTPETLEKIKRVTQSLDGHDFETRADERQALTEELEAGGAHSPAEIRAELDRLYPPYPVNHDQVRSLVHQTTRIVERNAAGDISSAVLISELPASQAEADALRTKVLTETPELPGALISADQKAALVTASFVTSRLDGPAVYSAVFDHLYSIVEREEDANHKLYVAGAPVVTGWVLAHAWEIGHWVASAYQGSPKPPAGAVTLHAIGRETPRCCSYALSTTPSPQLYSLLYAGTTTVSSSTSSMMGLGSSGRSRTN